MTSAHFILLVQTDTIELWQRRRRDVRRYATLSAAMDNFPAALSKLLQITRNRRLLVLLNLPDLSLIREPMPRTGRIDRYKIGQRRLDFHYPSHDITALWYAPAEIRLAGVRPSPWLRTVLNALGRCQCRICGIHHLALEMLGLLPLKTQQSGLLAAQLPGTLLLIAYHNREARLIRLLKDARTLSHELERTCHYMQREGWSPAASLTLTCFDVVPPAIDGWPKIRVVPQPGNALRLLLSRLLTHRPRITLKSVLLRKRQWHQRAIRSIRVGSLVALIGSALLWLTALTQLDRLDRQNSILRGEAALLPPVMAINDHALLGSLNPETAFSTLGQLENMSLLSFQLTQPTPAKSAASRLTLMTEPLPATNDILSQLSAWQPETVDSRTQGALVEDETPAPFAYNLVPKP